jgi:hypothetical protein
MKIYNVSTYGDCEGKSTRYLGSATGNQQDIRNYFKDKAVYDEIFLSEIVIINITPEMAAERQKLAEREKQLESELKSLKSVLR